MWKRSNTALVIDDNRIALVLSSKMVKSVVEDLNVITFSSGKEVIEYLEKAEDIPSVIFSDMNMEGMNGKDILSWCKRHPKFHTLPFIFLSGETTQEDLTKLGATDYCVKPLQPADVSAAYEKAKSKFMSFAYDADMEICFADESFELCHRLKEVLNTTLGEKEINEVYRIFHTIKGVSASMDFSYLATFVHKAENFLTIVKNQKKYSHPQVKSLLNEVHQHLIITLENLKAKVLMPEAPTTLMDNMLNIETVLSSATAVSEAPVAITVDNTAVVAKSDYIRVKHKDLDEIQAQLKKILQLKVQMNHFGRQLHEEFFDESFPKDLIQMITKLESSSLGALESLILLRVQSVDNLTPYCNKLVQELCKQLSKNCEITFSKTGTVEVDVSIIELLKAGFTHILRNAMDHGIETPEERTKSGKNPVGQIKVHYEKLENKTFKVEIKDDGRGIIKEKLKKILIAKNILSEEQVRDLNDHQINQMIFLDGLSTKTEVSDISGRGVGISAVKDDIEKMGGSLVVTSTEGQGTVFVITLPLYFIL